jgi:hypothetical protein
VDSNLEIEGYSLEQYTHPNETYTDAITNKLKIRTESLEEKKTRLAKNFCAQIVERIDVVKDSEVKRIYLDLKEHRCFNAVEYDDYSTPTRDKKLKATVEDLVRVEKTSGEITSEDITKMSSYLNECGRLEYYWNKNDSHFSSYQGLYGPVFF